MLARIESSEIRPAGCMEQQAPIRLIGAAVVCQSEFSCSLKPEFTESTNFFHKLISGQTVRPYPYVVVEQQSHEQETRVSDIHCNGCGAGAGSRCAGCERAG